MIPKKLNEVIFNCKMSGDPNIISLAIICEILLNQVEELRSEMQRGFKLREP